MTMPKRTERLPRPASELENLASYYDTHDTSAEMEDGEWVDPQPMRTTSLRLPSDVISQLKTLAHERGIRYTALLREIVEQAVDQTHHVGHDDLAQINARLARIEAAVSERPMPVQRSRDTPKAARTGSRTRKSDTSAKA
jgi:predicted DNA-binding protein